MAEAIWKFAVIAGALAVAVPAGPILLNILVGPKKPGKIKEEPYECGAQTVGDAWIRFGVQYYAYALLFVLFDVEVVLLFPVALVAKSMMAGSAFLLVVEVGVFLGIVSLGLVYAWGRGVLEWE